MKVKVLEIRKNSFVRRLQKMLNETFSGGGIVFKINYFLGESESGNKGIFFILTNNKFGSLYEKYAELKDHETPLDVEEAFIDSIINDFVFYGITALSDIKMKMINSDDPNTPLKSKIIFLN